MPVPKPRKRESTQAFISRCIRTLSHLDPDRPHKQIIAICYSAAKKAGRKIKRRKRR